jgi:hypothetical protein
MGIKNSKKKIYPLFARQSRQFVYSSCENANFDQPERQNIALKTIEKLELTCHRESMQNGNN